jgi:hypothetical protein
VPAPLRFIEQYFRPAIAVPFQVKQPSVRVKVAPVVVLLAQELVAVTGLVGRVAYAPGSIIDRIRVTFPPDTVAVNVAGELVAMYVPLVTVNVHVPLVV